MVSGSVKDQLIAPHGADHGKADTGVAAGRFDDRCSRFEGPVLFRRFDHGKTDAILDTAAGIAGFHFHINCRSILFFKPGDPDKGGVADQIEDRFVFVCWHSCLLCHAVEKQVRSTVCDMAPCIRRAICSGSGKLKTVAEPERDCFQM